jgi:hypothetical protein
VLNRIHSIRIYLEVNIKIYVLSAYNDLKCCCQLRSYLVMLVLLLNIGLSKHIDITLHKGKICLSRHCSMAEVLPGQPRKYGGLFLYSDSILILISYFFVRKDYLCHVHLFYNDFYLKKNIIQYVTLIRMVDSLSYSISGNLLKNGFSM